MTVAALMLASLVLSQTGIPGWTCSSTYQKCYRRLSAALTFSSALTNCAPASTGTTGSKLCEPSFLNGESTYIRQFVPFVPTVPTQSWQCLWLGVIRESAAQCSYASDPADMFDCGEFTPWGTGQPGGAGSGNYLRLCGYPGPTSNGLEFCSGSAIAFPLCQVSCT